MFLHEHPDFSAFIRIVANERGIREAIIEKDYWVTYALHELRNSEFRDAFIFKGGTSLSKGWNLIDRFSEDIDLLLVSDGLGSKAKKARMKKIQEFTAGLPGLSFEEGNRDNRAGNESRTCCFKYVRRTEGALGTLLPYIKLEMGYRGGVEPQELRKIQSVIAQELDKKGQGGLAKNITAVEMPLLHPRRALVEKLFAIYSAYESDTIAGKTRHYYDVYKLLELQEVVSFLGTVEYIALKESVAVFSRENWPDSPIPLEGELAKAAAFSPAGELRSKILTEYQRSDIFYGAKPQFEEIISRIQQFKSKF